MYLGYIERQMAQHCGIHALNMVMGFRAITENEMPAIGTRLLQRKADEGTLLQDEVMEWHIRGAGNYSNEILAEALRSMTPPRTMIPQAETGSADILLDQAVEGMLIYVPGHWMAARAQGNDLFVLDSLTGAKKLDTEGLNKIIQRPDTRAFLITSGAFQRQSHLIVRGMWQNAP